MGVVVGISMIVSFCRRNVASDGSCMTSVGGIACSDAGGQVAGGRASGGGGGVASAVGMGESRQQTPMLITEGNALSLLNRLSWETLRCGKRHLGVEEAKFETPLVFCSVGLNVEEGNVCALGCSWRNSVPPRDPPWG